MLFSKSKLIMVLTIQSQKTFVINCVQHYPIWLLYLAIPPFSKHRSDQDSEEQHNSPGGSTQKSIGKPGKIAPSDFYVDMVHALYIRWRSTRRNCGKITGSFSLEPTMPVSALENVSSLRTKPIPWPTMRWSNCGWPKHRTGAKNTHHLVVPQNNSLRYNCSLKMSTDRSRWVRWTTWLYSRVDATKTYEAHKHTHTPVTNGYRM